MRKRKLDTLDSGTDVPNPSAMRIERVSDESGPITSETISGRSLKQSQGLHLEMSRSRGLEKLINRHLERSIARSDCKVRA